VTLRHYTEDELEGVLPLHEAIEAMRAAFTEFAEGRAQVQLRTPTDAPGGFRLNTMAATLPSAGVAGAKVYTAYQSRFSFVVLLFSMEDGRVLASFDAGALTRLRTAAVSALAAQYLARPESETLVVFGTGVQAEGHATAFAQRFPIRRIRIVGRDGAAGFARRIAALTGLECASLDRDSALEGADIVVTATRAAQPLFDGRSLPPGCTVIAVGSSRPNAAEIDRHLLERARCIVVESEEAARHEAGDLLLADGTDAWNKLVTLGDLCAGRATGRANGDEILLFESLGLALEDVAIAERAWRRLNP
jgi:ornithine cyclodeaminase